MEQLYVQKQKFKLLSELLRDAYDEGLRKIEGKLTDYDGGYCAWGAITEMGKRYGYEPAFILKIIVKQLLNKDLMKSYANSTVGEFLTESEAYQMDNLVQSTIRLNDSGRDVTYLDCANYLEERGL